jgi:sporulation protein YlmC with PRC-barrel domain
MQKKHLTAAALLSSVMLAYPAFAQNNAGVDPACLVKNSDGTETVDMTKCPDGKTPGAANTTPPATDAPKTDPDAAAPAQDGTTGNTTTEAPATTPAQPSATATDDSVVVPKDSFAGAKVMTASDFMGKRVYTKAGEDIGEVNDLIVTDNGSVQAVVLGVGGFLGIGEKDVAVRMAAIEMQEDGEWTKLVVDATKEQLTEAPAYDRGTRTYVN